MKIKNTKRNKILLLLFTLLFSILLVGCTQGDPLRESSADRRAVMKIGGENVEFQEYRYFWMNNRRNLWGDIEEITAEQESELTKLVEKNLLDRHVLSLLADEFNVDLSSEELDSINSLIDNYRKGYENDDAYRQALRDQYMTEALLKDISSDTFIAYALRDEMGKNGAIDVSEEAFERAKTNDEILCLKEIYVYYPDDSMREWALGRAEEALKRLNDGESFEELMREYSSYSQEKLPPEHGYYTMKYDALDEIWEAAVKLKDGEWSEIVESAFGFHIVMRSERDNSYMAEIKDEIYDIFCSSRFYEYFYDYCSKVDIELTKYGESLNDSKIK